MLLAFTGRLAGPLNGSEVSLKAPQYRHLSTQSPIRSLRLPLTRIRSHFPQTKSGTSSLPVKKIGPLEFEVRVARVPGRGSLITVKRCLSFWLPDIYASHHFREEPRLKISSNRHIQAVSIPIPVLASVQNGTGVSFLNINVPISSIKGEVRKIHFLRKNMFSFSRKLVE